jgi:hypothetical protein
VTSSDEFVSLPSPPALKHRPQKHRGRIGAFRGTESTSPILPRCFCGRCFNAGGEGKLTNSSEGPRSSLDNKKKPEFNKKLPVTSSDEFVSLPSPPALDRRYLTQQLLAIPGDTSWVFPVFLQRN